MSVNSMAFFFSFVVLLKSTDTLDTDVFGQGKKYHSPILLFSDGS